MGGMWALLVTIEIMLHTLGQMSGRRVNAVLGAQRRGQVLDLSTVNEYPVAVVAVVPPGAHSRNLTERRSLHHPSCYLSRGKGRRNCHLFITVD